MEMLRGALSRLALAKRSSGVVCAEAWKEELGQGELGLGSPELSKVLSRTGHNLPSLSSCFLINQPGIQGCAYLSPEEQVCVYHLAQLLHHIPAGTDVQNN